MDRGLKLQNRLNRKGERIFSIIFDKLKSFDEECKEAKGVKLLLGESEIRISLIFSSNEKYIGSIKVAYRDKRILKEAIYSYLLNNATYKFDPKKDMYVWLHDYYFSLFCFWF